VEGLRVFGGLAKHLRIAITREPGSTKTAPSKAGLLVSAIDVLRWLSLLLGAEAAAFGLALVSGQYPFLQIRVRWLRSQPH
jgi:hypothetical protein